MFKSSEPPVSLFSFQDIITSLTGIMVFFLLLLSLNILESAKKVQDDSQDYKDLIRAREKAETLRKQIDDIESDVKNYQKKIQIAQKKDESALLLEQHRLEHELNDLKQQKNDFVLQKEEIEGDYSRIAAEHERLKKEQREIEQELQEIDNLESQIEQKKQEIADKKKSLDQGKNTVQISFDASIRKIPVLVECSENRICIVNTQGQEKRIISRKGPFYSDLVNEAVDKLRLFSPDKYYFTLLIKPSAATYLTTLKGTLDSTIKNADYGIEPIGEQEEVLK